MKTLIVDDLIENRKLLGTLLRPYGVCEMASDGAEAVEMFKAALLEGEPFDLVLLDIMMPGMNGQEALRQIRQEEADQEVEKGQETVIIMATALDSPQAVLQAFFKGGCTDYVSKPIRSEVLFEKLREYRLIVT
ncbi:MAG: response regulator [Magnetococcales bacterium]|nr:response regulator [Magnetococcales bacterium]